MQDIPSQLSTSGCCVGAVPGRDSLKIDPTRAKSPANFKKPRPRQKILELHWGSNIFQLEAPSADTVSPKGRFCPPTTPAFPPVPGIKQADRLEMYLVSRQCAEARGPNGVISCKQRTVAGKQWASSAAGGVIGIMGL